MWPEPAPDPLPDHSHKLVYLSQTIGPIFMAGVAGTLQEILM